jgi:hypothetical protein
LIYLRVVFWTLSGAYTAFLFSRGHAGSPIGTTLTAAFFGAILGFSLGGMFVNRETRKRS